MDKELFFRKICQICKTPAPSNGKHYFHYGAICCSKCKAFFRRCTRNADKYGPIANVFPCLSGTNNCELNYLSTVNCNLKEFKCKKCRLRKCLDAGMNCRMVLDEAQRLKYRNCFKKRQEKGASSSSHNSLEFQNSLESWECSSLPKPLPALIPISNPSRKPQVDNIHKAFLLSLAQLKFDTKNATELLNFHTKVNSSPDQFPWNCLIKHLCFYSDQFKEFANSLPEFQILSSNLVNLKEKMLKNSCEMYLHYIFAKYILSTNGIDQLWWLFDGHLENTSGTQNEIQLITKEQLKSKFLPIHLSFMASILYLKCFDVIEEHHVPNACNGLMANFLLYQYNFHHENNTDFLLNPSEKITVDNLAEEAMALIVAETSHIPIPITRENLNAIVWALQLMSRLLKFDQIIPRLFPF